MFDKLKFNKLEYVFITNVLRDIYPKYMLNKKNYEKDYQDVKKDIQKVFTEINSMKNDLILKSDLSSLEIEEYNKLIDKTKKEVIKDEEQLKIIKQETQASKPRKQEFIYELNIAKIDFFYNLLKLTIISYFIYKILK